MTRNVVPLWPGGTSAAAWTLAAARWWPRATPEQRTKNLRRVLAETRAARLSPRKIQGLLAWIPDTTPNMGAHNPIHGRT